MRDLQMDFALGAALGVLSDLLRHVPDERYEGVERKLKELRNVVKTAVGGPLSPLMDAMLTMPPRVASSRIASCHLVYNECSLCSGCGSWSVTVEALDQAGTPIDGFRLLGQAKTSRTVRVLDPSEKLYRESYEAMLQEPRAAEYVPFVAPPEVRHA